MTPPTGERLALLRDALVGLYPRDDDSRRVVTDAGVSTGRIDFSGSATNRWFHALEEADRQGRLGDVVRVAWKEYPSNASLLAALEASGTFVAPNAVEVGTFESATTASAADPQAGESGRYPALAFPLYELVVEGAEARVFPLTRTRVTVGRDQGACDIALADPQVSRSHCSLNWDPLRSSFVLVDHGTFNGVLLNGDPQRRPKTLRDGDELVVGATRVRYRRRHLP